jgi:DNA primase
MYDIEKVKEAIESEDIFTLLEYLNAEPVDHGSFFTCKTICHNHDDIESASHKLYYYINTSLFHCFSECGESFDIFELICKVKEIDLDQAVFYVVNFLNLQWKIDDPDSDYNVNEEDKEVFSRYNKIDELVPKENNKLELAEIDKNILKYFPQPRYLNWEKEGISKDVCDLMDIHYNPLNGSIIIPHYDENNRLVGIRQRALVKEDEEYGKYRPAYIQGKIRSHPLSFNLYGLNKAKPAIKDFNTAIVFESEKSVLRYIDLYGLTNDIAVACCGNNLSEYQFQLLLDSGATEICIAFDKDFHELDDDDCRRVVDRLKKLNQKYRTRANISILFDKENLLGYKMAPIEKSKAIFEHLFRERIVL